MKRKAKGKFTVGIGVALAAVMILAIIVARFLGFSSVRSTIRIGCVERADLHNWSANYFYMDGYMERTLYPNDDALNVVIKTESGGISITIKDDAGENIFSESNIETGTFQVAPTSSRVVVTIRTEKHKGGFEISS